MHIDGLRRRCNPHRSAQRAGNALKHGRYAADAIARRDLLGSMKALAAAVDICCSRNPLRNQIYLLPQTLTSCAQPNETDHRTRTPCPSLDAMSVTLKANTCRGCLETLAASPAGSGSASRPTS